MKSDDLEHGTGIQIVTVFVKEQQSKTMCEQAPCAKRLCIFAGQPSKPCEEDFLHAKKEATKWTHICVPDDLFYKEPSSYLKKRISASRMEP